MAAFRAHYPSHLVGITFSGYGAFPVRTIDVSAGVVRVDFAELAIADDGGEFGGTVLLSTKFSQSHIANHQPTKHGARRKG